MEIISKQQAKAAGLKRYFTGTPCSRGHLVYRCVAGGVCSSCQADRQMEWRNKHRDIIRERSRDWYLNNKEKHKVSVKNWSSRNKAKMREAIKSYQVTHKAHLYACSIEWRRANPERTQSYTKRFRLKNSAKIKEMERAYRAKNRPKLTAKQRARESSKIKATPPWADKKAIENFYEQARRLTMQTGVPHEVDHIYPLRSDRVCGLHCEANLQIITGEQNRRKSNISWPGCETSTDFP